MPRCQPSPLLFCTGSSPGPVLFPPQWVRNILTRCFFSLNPIKLPRAFPPFLLPSCCRSCCLRHWLWFGHSPLLTW